MNLFIRLVIMFVALSGIIYFMYRLNTDGINPMLFQMEPAVTYSFVPKEVSRFFWKTPDKEFSYNKSSKGAWIPEEDEDSIKKTLSFLAQIQLEPVEQKGRPFIEVALTIQEDRWAGTWDGLSFLWTEGPHKGFGEVLNNEKNKVFFRGKFIFTDLKIDLCKELEKVSYWGGLKSSFALEKKDASWGFVDKGSSEGFSSETLNSFMSRWEKDLCKVQLKTVIDPRFAQSDVQTGSLTLAFKNEPPQTLRHLEKNLFLSQDGYGLILEGLDHSIEVLKNQLAPASNP